MMTDKTYNEPSEVDAKDGVVSMDGPDNVHIKLTSDAADETSDRLLHGSMKARGQQVREEQVKRARRYGA